MKHLFPITNNIFSNFTLRLSLTLVIAFIVSVGIVVTSTIAQTNQQATGDADSLITSIFEIAPIGMPVVKYMDVPASAKGPAIDPVKGYRIQELGKGLYIVTDNAYQSMFMVYEKGVVVIDAPPSYAKYIRKAIAEVTNNPVTHIVYSHSHSDHIGGAKNLGSNPVIIAHEETKRLLERANDPSRPLPTVAFQNHYRLKAGSQILVLSYHGIAHQPGNIFIYAPIQKTLMVVDLISPGWMPFRRLHMVQNVRGHYDQVEEIRKLNFDTLVGGHVARTGTKADVELYSEFLSDLKTAAAESIKTTKFGIGLDPRDLLNPWATFDNHIDRAVALCVSKLTPKWATKLAAYDIYIWDQCYTVDQSLRID